MNIPDLSDGLLKKLHDAVRDAFEDDEAAPAGHKKYGVREFQDWRETADALEAELKKRNVDHEPIPWSLPPTPKAPVRVFYYGKNTLGPGGPKPGGPKPGEVYVIQHTARGEFFVERLSAQHGRAEQLGGPFESVAEAQTEAARH